MNWINVVAISIGLVVMVRASILLSAESLLPASMHGILQVIGGLAIVVTTLSIVLSPRNLNEWARGALSLKSVNTGRETMKAILGIACVLAISVAIFPFEASAQGRGGGMGGGLGASSSQGGGLRGLDRAD